MSFDAMPPARDALRFRFRGGEVGSPTASRRARPCSTGCARTGRQGHEGRLRGGRLRRLHGRAGAAQGRARSTYEPVNACILLPGPARRRRTDHGRGPRRRRRPPSGAAGDGRSARLAMRLLHARHRDEPVRRLSFRRARDPVRSLNDQLAGNLCRCTGYRPDPRRGAGDLQRRAGRPFRARRATSALTRSSALADRRRPVRRRRGGLLRRAREPRLARRALCALSRRDAGRRGDRRRALGHQAVARPASGSSGSAGSPVSTRSTRAPGRRAFARRRRHARRRDAAAWRDPSRSRRAACAASARCRCG